MQIREAFAWMLGSSEQIVWTQPCFIPWHVVVQVDGVLNRQWPKLGVGCFRPMDGSM
jgi:hypothetical protein